ncbi:MAG: TolC family protein [Planctomycetota bacterium]|nr:TolC family protein [Planctomycetota bacterium]
MRPAPARFPVPAAVLALASGLLVSCTPPLESDWRRIDRLESRLGTIETLDGGDALQARPATPVPSSNADDVAKVEGLMSLMSTGTPRDLNLAEVRRSTLENNLSIQSSLLGPEVAAQQLRAEQAKFEWTLVASVEDSRVVSAQPTIAQLYDETANSFTASPGLDIPLRTGGTVTVDWTLESTSYDQSNIELPISTSQPTVSIQQPILRGGGFDYNEASIVIAGANLGVSRAEAQGVVINQLIRAEIAYWQLHLAWKLLEIDLQLYTTSRQLLEEQRKLVDVGAGSIANVYNFESLLASSVQSVIASELQVRSAVRAVKVVMQEPDLTLDGSVALTPVSEPRLVGFDFDARRLVTLAFENRTELLELEFQQLSRTVEVMLRENEVLPQIDLVGSWSGNGFARGLSIPDATRDLFDNTRQPGWSMGLTASVPLGNDVALANYQAAILQRLQTVADRRQQEILVTQQVLDAIDALEAGWNQILTTELQLRAAQRFYAAYETLFNRGQIPSSNLTQALQELNQAKIQKVSAEVDYQIDLAQLALAAGCLLGHAQVDWVGDLDRERLERPGEPPLGGIPTGSRDELEEDQPTLQDLIDRMPATPDDDGSGDRTTTSTDETPVAGDQ